MENLIIYTDGAYSSARDQGGIGVVFVRDGINIKSYNKMFKHVSNNKMELAAVIIALKTVIKNNLTGTITIITDSQYVIGCATKGWKRRKNVKLWETYDKLCQELNNRKIIIEFKWVHGHTGDTFNEIADKLAVEASKEISIL